MAKKWSEKINQGIWLMIRLFFGAIAVYLLILAAFSTTVLNDVEHPRLVGDQPLVNVLLALLLVAGLLWLRTRSWWQKWWRTLETDTGRQTRARHWGLMVIALLGVSFVLTTQIEPGSDQSAVLHYARDWINHDYRGFVPGAYLDSFPNQYGLVLILYWGSWLVGSYNYLFWQLLNVVGIVLIYRTLARLSDSLGQPRNQGLILIWLGSLFVPLLLYANFLYGTIWGLTLALMCWEQVNSYLETRQIKAALLALAFAFGSLMLKSNYLIFVLGVAVWLMLQLWSRGRWRQLWLVAALLATLLITQPVINGLVYYTTGQKPSPGLSSLSWIAMGLHYNSSHIYKGWWDYYNTGSYHQAHHDRRLQAQYAREEIAKCLEYLIAHPALALQFFADKNASQWNNPDFGGLLLNQKHPSSMTLSPLAGWLFSPVGGDFLVQVLNYGQFICLVGVVAYCYHARSDRGWLALAIIICGGFVFHTFWEAKSQYILPYFTLFLPISLAGWRALLVAVETAKTQRQSCRQLMIGWGSLVALMIVVATRAFSPLNIVFYLVHDRPEYQAYLNQRHYVHLRHEGDYYLVPVVTADYRVGVGPAIDSQEFKAALVPAATGELIVRQSSAQAGAIFFTPEWPDERYLEYHYTLEDKEATKEVTFHGYRAEGRPMRWQLVPVGDTQDEYYLFASENYCLTAHPASRQVFLSWFVEAPEQRWRLVAR
ncbi:hypothetical protein IJJ08_00145 [bacterium]|nr:hypothetical protein [bacterium]